MSETIDTAALALRVADDITHELASDSIESILPIILCFHDAEARALAALLRGVVDGPKVKPLEWHWDPPYSTARAICGHYAVERWEDYAGLFHFDLIGSFITKRDEFSTLAEAKSAAQADYEQRIRSALDLPCSAEPSGVVWHPIETAPRDDTILVAVAPTEKNPVKYNTAVYPAYIDENGNICDCSSWNPDNGLNGEFWKSIAWMPLPSPPLSTTKEG